MEDNKKGDVKQRGMGSLERKVLTYYEVDIQKPKSNMKVSLLDTLWEMTKPKYVDRITTSGKTGMKEFEVNKKGD